MLARHPQAHSAPDGVMDAPSLPDSPPPPDRRRFLTRLSLALSGAVGALLGVPVVGFLLAPLIRRYLTTRHPLESEP